MVKDSARALLGQAGVVLVLASMGATLSGPARAGTPDPDPGPSRVQTPRPDPAPNRRREQTSSTSQQTPTVHPPAPATQPSSFVAPPPPVAPQPVSRPPAPARSARTEGPKRPAVTKSQRPRGSRKQRAKQTLRAIRSAATTDSPDGMLLAGGLALFALLLGEAIFLALSVRVLRKTA